MMSFETLLGSPFWSQRINVKIKLNLLHMKKLTQKLGNYRPFISSGKDFKNNPSLVNLSSMYIQVWILQTIWFLKSFFFILDILLLKYVAQLLKQINLKVFHLINKDFCQVWYNWPPSSRVEDENNKNNDETLRDKFWSEKLS